MNINNEQEKEVKQEYQQIQSLLASAVEEGRGVEITDEDFLKAKKTIDNILNITKRFNEAELEKYCNEYQIDIRSVDPSNYVNLMVTISHARYYLVEQEKRMIAYLNWLEKSYDLLSAFLSLESGKKTADLRKNESLIKLKFYYLKKQQCNDLLLRVQGKREAAENAYDSLSRILSFWEFDAKNNPTRVIHNK